MDKLYTISEVADKLNLTAKTLRRWEESGRFTPSRTLGGQRRYSLLDLQILDAIKHNTIPNSQDLLTIDQAAAQFGVTPATIARWENEGRIHPLITAGITYYPRHRLLEKIFELKNATSSYDNKASFSSFSPPPEPSLKTSPSPKPFKLVRSPLSDSTTSLPEPLSRPQSKTLPPDFHTTGFFANLTITLILIITYHLLFGSNSGFRSPSSKSSNKSSSLPSGLVQGSTTTRDPSLVLLDSILDSTGALTAKASLTTPLLALTPSTPPTGATPGTLYFDATSLTLKLFTSTWTDLPGPQTLKVANTNLLSGSGTLLKNQSSITVNHESLDSTSSISLTFNSDYSPAKKYWLTTASGSFTLHTDFPVAKNTLFSYLILTPSKSESPAPATIEPAPLPIPTPSPLPSNLPFSSP